VASWELSLAAVAETVGAASAETFFARAARTKSILDEATRALRRQGVTEGLPNWSQRRERPAAKQQRAYAKQADQCVLDEALSTWGEDDAADLRSAGGKGAGAFLLPPTEARHVMSDLHYLVAVQRRLRCRHPGHTQPTTTPATHCQHRAAQGGALCGKESDPRGHHAETCNTGGLVDARHNDIRDWLGSADGKKGLIPETTGRSALTEQHVPHWDRVDEETGEVEHARLDVATTDAEGRRVYLDITIVDAATVNPEQRRRRRANHDGAAAARAEDTKRLRYPGPALVPFAVEALGRPGENAVNHLRSLAPVDPRARSKWLGSAWQTLSVLVQTGNARLLLTAAHAA